MTTDNVSLLSKTYIQSDKSVSSMTKFIEMN